MTRPPRSTTDLIAAIRADADEAMDAPAFLTTHPIASRAHRSRGPVAVAIGVVLAVALAVTAMTVRHFGSRGTSKPASSPMSVGTDLVGTSWVLAKVSDTRTTVNIARDHPASMAIRADTIWIEFEPNGFLLTNDGTNIGNGHYSMTSRGLTLRTTFQTFAGRAFPQWLLTAGGEFNRITSHGLVHAQRHGTELRLTIPGVAATFHQGPPASEAPLRTSK